MSTPAPESDVAIGGASGGFPAAPLRRAMLAVLHGEQRAARIALTFLAAPAMRRLNDSAFGHDYPTDVISFALPQPDGSLMGDVYLCRAVAARNARAHGVSLREELRRLAIHGTLHVLGWDHPDGAERLRSPMWRRQEAYLRAAP